MKVPQREVLGRWFQKGYVGPDRERFESRGLVPVGQQGGEPAIVF